MPLTPEQLAEIRTRAEQIWGPTPPNPTAYTDEYKPEFIEYVAQLKRDILFLAAEIERLWLTRGVG